MLLDTAGPARPTQRIALLGTAVQVTGLVVTKQPIVAHKLKTSNSTKWPWQCACQSSLKVIGFNSSMVQHLHSNTITAAY